MTNSSQPQDYLTTSSDVGFIAQDVSSVLPGAVTIDLSSLTSDTITLTGGSSYQSAYSFTSTAGTGSYTVGNITGPGISTITLNDFTTEYKWTTEEWINSFPAWDRIQKMCDQYPGLKIAFEKFKTTYKLVKDDYDSLKDKE